MLLRRERKAAGRSESERGKRSNGECQPPRPQPLLDGPRHIHRTRRLDDEEKSGIEPKRGKAGSIEPAGLTQRDLGAAPENGSRPGEGGQTADRETERKDESRTVRPDSRTPRLHLVQGPTVETRVETICSEPSIDLVCPQKPSFGPGLRTDDRNMAL